MPSFDVVFRDRPGGANLGRAGFWVNHADLEEARRMACSLLDLPAEKVGLVPAQPEPQRGRKA